MESQIRYTPHAVYQINDPFVWIPRYRKTVMQGDIADGLKQLIYAIAQQYEFDILAREGMPDHVHLFVSAPPKYAPAQVVRLFKGVTSGKLKQAFEYLRRQYWGKNATLWAESYYVGTAGHVSAETIRKYIEENRWT
jgi:putative transposase